jgi:NAD(P)-dependent dehydrogenase (short-subunit alcohol dehydrogenase family)
VSPSANPTAGALADKVAIVTGVRGIGAGVAQALVAAGARVALLDIDGQHAKATATVLGGPPTAVPLTCDVTDRAQVDATVATVAGWRGRIDVLVNCAQWLRAGVPLAELAAADLTRTIDSGLMGTFHMMQACYPHLKAGGGAIVNFGSSAGTHGQRGLGGYAAAKEGIRGLSRVAALEWGRDGITVNVICPSVMSEGAQVWARDNPELHQGFLARRAVPREGDALSDIGATVVFLAGPGASFISGETLMVNGGGTMRP